MTGQKKIRSLWKSPFKLGLAIFSGIAYAAVCILEQRLSGDTEWLYLYSLLFVGSIVCAAVEPERMLEIGAMPFFSVLLVGITGLGGSFFLVTLLLVLGVCTLGAFLGAALARMGKCISKVKNQDRELNNKPDAGDVK